MAFHFTLEAVLRYRRAMEKREQLGLQRLLGLRAAVLRELEQSYSCRRRFQATIQGALQQGPIPAAEVQFSVAQLHGLEQQEETLRARLLQVDLEVAQQRLRYQQEQQRREVLESLREAQLRDYLLRQRRRQQARLDELHLLRAARRPNLPSELGKPCPSVGQTPS